MDILYSAAVRVAFWVAAGYGFFALLGVHLSKFIINLLFTVVFMVGRCVPGMNALLCSRQPRRATKLERPLLSTLAAFF